MSSNRLVANSKSLASSQELVAPSAKFAFSEGCKGQSGTALFTRACSRNRSEVIFPLIDWVDERVRMTYRVSVRVGGYSHIRATTRCGLFRSYIKCLASTRMGNLRLSLLQG